MNAPFRFLPLVLLALSLIPTNAHAQLAPSISTADDERFAYHANTGWTNWRWDTSDPGDGATVTQFCLSGFVYSANCGWIDLGDGAPQNGIQYQNQVVAAQNDFGVNHDGNGNLSGFAYAANIGWINFGNPATWNDPPKINLLNGQMSGYAYSANCGWLDLGTNGTVRVKTDSIEIKDSDNDMIDDAWEFTQLANASMTLTLATLTKTGDNDNDGQLDLEEYLADTDPFDPNDTFNVLTLGITIPPAPNNVDITWTSKTTRAYQVSLSTTNLDPGSFSDLGSAVIGLSPTTTALFPDPLPRNKFWKVEAKLPLSP
ncbi:MAG: hypothetical protein AAF591_04850 [Verrucomicrobiota bacterium]